MIITNRELDGTAKLEVSRYATKTLENCTLGIPHSVQICLCKQHRNDWVYVLNDCSCA